MEQQRDSTKNQSAAAISPVATGLLYLCNHPADYTVTHRMVLHQAHGKTAKSTHEKVE